jgi:hypothetical protein
LNDDDIRNLITPLQKQKMPTEYSTHNSTQKQQRTSKIPRESFFISHNNNTNNLFKIITMNRETKTQLEEGELVEEHQEDIHEPHPEPRRNDRPPTNTRVVISSSSSSTNSSRPDNMRVQVDYTKSQSTPYHRYEQGYSQEPNIPFKRIYIGNLKRNLDVPDFEQIMRNFGYLDECAYLNNGTAFVTFLYARDALHAVKSLNNMTSDVLTDGHIRLKVVRANNQQVGSGRTSFLVSSDTVKQLYIPDVRSSSPSSSTRRQRSRSRDRTPPLHSYSHHPKYNSYSRSPPRHSDSHRPKYNSYSRSPPRHSDSHYPKYNSYSRSPPRHSDSHYPKYNNSSRSPPRNSRSNYY